jgi:S-adenosylmethionine:tRNA ribosyltransferase-isomerase
MVGNLKKWKEGPLTLSGECKGIAFTLTAERLETTGNTHSIRFSWDNGKLSFAEILDSLGELPIPPYLNRATEESDKTTYQTVYSKIKGSVAAPTAGLHFTDKVLDGLRKRGVRMEEVTLHVGAGTFQPVKTEDANEHEMHTEVIAVPKKTIKAILDNLGGIVAVGTTSMRTLESLYYIGLQLKDTFAHFPYEECKFEDYPWKGHRFDLKVKQFEPYTTYSNCSTEDALREILYYLKLTEQETLHAETQIMIKPGYRFRVVDALITNFHQPKSTLLLLVSAFVGDDWRKIYDYALTHDFRFLSYGDSSYLVRNNRTL